MENKYYLITGFVILLFLWYSNPFSECSKSGGKLVTHYSEGGPAKICECPSGMYRDLENSCESLNSELITTCQELGQCIVSYNSFFKEEMCMCYPDIPVSFDMLSECECSYIDGRYPCTCIDY